MQPHHAAPLASAAPGGTASAVLWRHRGQSLLTIVLKTTFRIAPSGAVERAEPGPILRDDVHFDRRPTRSVQLAADLAPVLLRKEITFVGRAWSPSGAPGDVPVRLAVLRGERAVIERSLVARFDGSSRSLPLDHEHALGGPGVRDNPVGTPAPQVIDAAHPGRPGALGPIGRLWPVRRDRLRGLSRRALSAPVLELPDDFDLAFFQAAPPEQQLSRFRAGDAVALEGLHPDCPRLVAPLPLPAGWVRRLPGMQPFRANAPPMTIDSIAIDGDAWTCDVVLRGLFDLESFEAVAGATIECGASFEQAAEVPEQRPSLPSIPPPWPAPAPPPPAPLPAEERTSLLSFWPPPPPPPEERTSLTSFWPPPPPQPPPPMDPLPEVAAEAPRAPELLQTMASDEGGDRGSVLPFDPAATSHLLPVEAPRGPELRGAALGQTASLSDEEQAAAAVRLAFPFLTEAPPPSPPGGAADDSAPRLFVRKSDLIPVVVEGPLTACNRPASLGRGKRARTFIVKASFDLDPTGKVTPRAEPSPLTGDVIDPEGGGLSISAPSDFSVYKPRADVTASGAACVVGPPAAGTTVSFSFGRGANRFAREIRVVGDRVLGEHGPSAPAPFARMPLTWTRAAGGGPGSSNPLGRAPAIGALLPNLEDAARSLRSPEAATRAVCFAPVPPSFPARTSRMGTFDEDWIRDEWPYFPRDVDWACEQHAPEEQRLDHLTGDEPFELRGMRAELPVLRGELPGARARAFVQRTTASGGAFFEIVLRLDTAHFDVEALRLDLVWRGLVPVEGDDASDVAGWFALLEDSASPAQSLDEVRRRFERTHVRLAVWPASPEEVRPENDTARGGSELLDRVRAAQGEAGLPSPGAPPPAAAAAAATTSEGPGEDPFAPQREADGARREADLRSKIDDGSSFEGEDLEGADFSGMDLTGRSFARARLQRASFKRARLDGADFTGAALAGADLRHASAAGAIFAGADLTGCRAEQATFDRAQLASATLDGIDAPRATFREAEGARAHFVGAVLRGASFEKAHLPSADFTRAILDKASFDGARLPAVRFYEARGSAVTGKKADLTGARADGVTLTGGSFPLAVAPDSIWDGAVLDRTSFLGAKLARSGFTRASGAGAVFSGADLSSSIFDGAALEGASFLKASLMEASLEGADLTRADLRAANLHAAALWRTTLRGARTELAIKTGTRLERRR